jgi:hypothetical protein
MLGIAVGSAATSFLAVLARDGFTLKQLVGQYGVLPPAPVTPTNP